VAAIREFKEETGFSLQGEFKALSPIKQKAGKTVYAWAIEGNVDTTKVKSNFFEMEWPPRSGKKQSFPEIDKACWYTLSKAREKINSSQAAWLDQLLQVICMLFENRPYHTIIYFPVMQMPHTDRRTYRRSYHHHRQLQCIVCRRRYM
jgi:predicted NUDIX family NTP pyrophosphohydrolase